MLEKQKKIGRRDSLKYAAGAVVGAAAVGAGWAASQYVPGAAPISKLSGEIPIGWIECADIGMSRPSLQVATEDINGWLQQVGIPVTVKFLWENSNGSASKSLEEVQSLAAQGVKVFLGMNWSSHVKAVLGYVTDHHMMIFSDSSSSPLLSVPNRGPLFRRNPDDSFQGKALAKAISSKGVKAIVIFENGDDWGDGLYAAIKSRFEELGGTVVDQIRFDPSATDFTAEAKKLSDDINGMINTYGKENVGVELIALPTNVVAIQQAVGQYPQLLQVPWFGADGYANIDALVKQAGNLAVQAHHFATYPAPTRSVKYEAYVNKFKAITGQDPIGYVINTYDTAWIVVYCMLMAGKYDADVIVKMIPQVADSYFGASGWTLLNDVGDGAGTNYDIFGVVDSSNPHWEVVGSYDYIADSVTWFQ
jgi:branched-chain amino acid transport system substrate-binding protein